MNDLNQDPHHSDDQTSNSAPPSQPSTPVDHPPENGKSLLDELVATMRRFVVLPLWAAETLALWILHTHAFELRDVSSYLGIESPEKRCGKTTLLGLLRKLVNRPVVAANISPPAFFRVIEQTRPTLLIDEADTFLKGNQLRGILNAGYSVDTSSVWRVANHVKAPNSKVPAPKPEGNTDPDVAEVGNESEAPSTGHPSPNPPSGSDRRRGPKVAEYSCWCPKVIAAIGRLPDTLADRCIVLRLQRKTADEKCERLRTFDGTALRQRCSEFAKENASAIASARPASPDSLNDRAADIWEPLFALADLAGGDWPGKAREAALALSGDAPANCAIAGLLLDILAVFAEARPAGGEMPQRMFTRDLLKGLNDLAGQPWAEPVRPERSHAVRVPMTEQALARRLRPYGIRPTTFRIEAALGKGYLLEEVMEALRRYVPKQEALSLLGSRVVEQQPPTKPNNSGNFQQAA